jgi:cysteine-rich repeat protein
MRTALRPTGRLFLALVAVCMIAALTPARAYAFEANVTKVPNPVYTTNGIGQSRACITCHNNPDGGSGCTLGDPVSDPLGHCWNEFGRDFYMNGQVWDATLAGVDSDGDGFTNGQELQDFAGLWTLGQTYPGVGSHATRPGFASSTPGQSDADGDGYCWVGSDANGDGDCLDAGENDGDIDCNDNDGAIHSGATEVCTNTADDDCNGLSTVQDPVCAGVVDADGDGYCPTGQDLNHNGHCLDAGEAGSTVDCDDTRVTVHPGASESCADGLDNDCDDKVDGTDPQCTGEADADADGFCPIGEDLNHDGDCLDAGEPEGPSDCDDAVAEVNPGAAEVCTDAYDNDCDDLPNLLDPDCEVFLDKDGDGECPMGSDTNGDGDCIDVGEDTTAADCNDGDMSVYSGAVELCSDLADQDCDGFGGLDDEDCFIYRDLDGDGFCPVGVDKNGDGDCADGAIEEVPGVVDCNDDDVTVNPLAAEQCFDGEDDNCNGVADERDPACAAYVDVDYDGYCQPGRDMNDDGDCTDAGEQTADMDDYPSDPRSYPGAHEHCLDTVDNDQDGLVDADDSSCTYDTDADGDGFCALGRDDNGDGDCNDEGEQIEATDCNDEDDGIYPGAEELCLVNADTDCDARVYLDDGDCIERFTDRDGDGFCGHGVDDDGDGLCVNPAEQRYGVDCDDWSAQISPLAREVCDDAIDNDCDGAIDRSDANCHCTHDAECPSVDLCTMGVCYDGVCRYEPNPVCDSGSCSVAPSGDVGGAGKSGWPFVLAFLGLGLFLGWRRSLRRSALALFIALGTVGTADVAFAYENYGEVPNEVAAYSANNCLLCHQTAAGGSQCSINPALCTISGCAGNYRCHNRFGMDLIDYGGGSAYAHTWSKALAQRDSDGDGWSNGQELGDPFGRCTCNSATSSCSCSAPTGSYRSNPGLASSEPTDGSYECTVDDCDTSPSAACSSYSASDGRGRYACDCPSGYAGSGHLYTNLNGSWGCTGTLGASCYTITTGPGCTNINECGSGTPCGPGQATCTDKSPGWTCTCQAGYTAQASGIGQYCVGSDECSPDGAVCGPHRDTSAGADQGCFDATPGWTCACLPGYVAGASGLGQTCRDANECANEGSGNDCDANATCTNTDGGFTCSCNDGFAGSGSECVDVDECALGMHDCDSTVEVCTNTSGSFTCNCKGGYTNVGGSCVDIDECALGLAGCDTYATCTNLSGAYDCTCNEGFIGSGLVGGCIDFDECASGGGCGEHEVCINRLADANLCRCAKGFARLTAGGSCVLTCGDGLRGEGEECDDGNEEDGDGCTGRCAIESGWACFDDAETTKSACEQTCGDGVLRIPGEQCDDGEGNSDTAANACRTTCRFAACGDGVIDGGEECDDGDANSDLAAGACRTSCKLAYCGDGVLDMGETCDFGRGEPAGAEACTTGCYDLPDAGTGGGATRGTGGCSIASPGVTALNPPLGVLLLALGALARRGRRRTRS